MIPYLFAEKNPFSVTRPQNESGKIEAGIGEYQRLDPNVLAFSFESN